MEIADPQTSFVTAEPEHPLLDDPWGNQSIVLDGVLERNEFSPILVGGLSLVLTLFIFNIIGAIFTIIFLVASGADLNTLLSNEFAEMLGTYATALLSANGLGLVLGIALPTWLYVRMSTRQIKGFLRLRPADARLMLLSIAGLVALLPIVWWLGSVNELIPLPEWIIEFEESQMALIEQVFSSQINVALGLLLLAVAPGIAEELFFRGYVQRQMERRMGIIWAIVITGTLFGLYHMRLTQALPLSVLGIYLCYLTWRTGSLWPAIVVHFLNNALAVVVGNYISARPDLDMESFEAMDVPWYAVVAGIALFSLIFVNMQRRAEVLLAVSPSSPEADT